jgi:hypothetical protein
MDKVVCSHALSLGVIDDPGVQSRQLSRMAPSPELAAPFPLTPHPRQGLSLHPLLASPSSLLPPLVVDEVCAASVSCVGRCGRGSLIGRVPSQGSHVEGDEIVWVYIVTCDHRGVSRRPSTKGRRRAQPSMPAHSKAAPFSSMPPGAPETCDAQAKTPPPGRWSDWQESK